MKAWVRGNISFSREIYIERDDFMEVPHKNFFRLFPGGEVRLKSAYIIKCEEVIKDSSTGQIKEIICTYYPETRSGGPQSGRKVKSTLHWLSVPHAIKAEVRLYDRLFNDPEPDGHKDRDFKEFIKSGFT